MKQVVRVGLLISRQFSQRTSFDSLNKRITVGLIKGYVGASWQLGGQLGGCGKDLARIAWCLDQGRSSRGGDKGLDIF